MTSKRFAAITTAVAVLGALAVAVPLVWAQPPAGAPAAAPAGAPPARAPAANAKPGYVVPPENSAGLYPVAGEPIWKAKCAACHDTPVSDRAPSRKGMEVRGPEDIYDVITVGGMKAMAAGLSEAEMYGLVRFITGKSPVPNAVAAPDTNVCKVHGKLQPNGPSWNGWSPTPENLRYQPKPGFTADQLPKMKVKWAFSYVGTKNGAPVVIGDRVFVNSMSGKVYSLDAKSGCVHWRFDYRGGSRSTMNVGKNAKAPSGYALYMGDDREFVRAFDAESGKLLWTNQVDDHKVGRITGSTTLYNGILYVPLSAAEESQGNVAAYNCCTFIGTVVAVDVLTGKTLWKQSVLPGVTPRATRKNSAGTQMYGPAGGAIWSATTVDAKRGLLYAATGDSYTEIDHPTSDAIVAFDLKTGKIKWAKQVLANDNFMSGTINGPLGVRGPDYDFGSAPMLVKLPNGKDAVVTGNKSAITYAMNPDTGEYIWESAKLGSGGASGGILWGTATDGKIVYAPLQEGNARGKPGMVALDITNGKELWRYNSPLNRECNVPSGRCSPGFSAAATAIPGAVIHGGLDGRIRAFAAADGKMIWETDTTLPIDTVNGVKGAYGGSMDMGGVSVAGGMMYVHSGYGGSAGANNLLLAYSIDGK